MSSLDCYTLFIISPSFQINTVALYPLRAIFTRQNFPICILKAKKPVNPSKNRFSAIMPTAWVKIYSFEFLIFSTLGINFELRRPLCGGFCKSNGTRGIECRINLSRKGAKKKGSTT
jgi:hypothetical protein